MLDRLTSAHVQSRAASPATNLAAPSDVVVNAVPDTGAAIAWKPLAGAQTYTVYRATSGNNNFARLGSVSGPSFGDAGLPPATSYAYKVTATTDNGNEGPSSPVLTATTRHVPPRCDQPGTCPVP